MQSSCDIWNEETSIITATECTRACVLSRSNASLEAARKLCSQYEWDGVFGPIRITSYAFDTLKNPETQDASIRNAINANLLIISTDQGDLPSSVRFWMGKFIGSKSNQLCTLVALTKLHHLDWDSPRAVREYLHAIADLERMPFAPYRFDASEADICLLADEDEGHETWNCQLDAPPPLAATAQGQVWRNRADEARPIGRAM
jgi:hypothetical protein